MSDLRTITPSKQNEKYYCREASLLYSDDKGTVFKGDIDKSWVYYCANTVFSIQNGIPQTGTAYRRLSQAAVESAKQNDDGTWSVSAENALIYFDKDNVSKSENKTQTLAYANSRYPDEKGGNFSVGTDLGNNGKLTLKPATGIKLSKAVDVATEDSRSVSFEFIITNKTDGNDSKDYDAMLKHADGSTDEVVVSFENGKDTVSLKADETIYIKGMTDGTKYTVEEIPNDKYVVDNINGDSEATSAEITVERCKLSEVSFVNTKQTDPTDPTEPTTPTVPTNPTIPTNPSNPKNDDTITVICKTSDGKAPDTPKTGDERSVMIPLAALLLSGAVLLGVSVYKRRKKMKK